MTTLSWQAITGTALWFALIALAQIMTPGQSFMSMGMSGLARGRVGWAVKLGFVLRGMVALALVAAVCESVPAAARSPIGMMFFTVWGGGSALLAAYNTDMPGDKPTRHGRAHALIALVAYVAGAVGMILMSLQLDDSPQTATLAPWALAIALAAWVALFAQFAGFAAAARTPGRGLAPYAGLLQRVFVALLMVWVVVVALGI